MKFKIIRIIFNFVVGVFLVVSIPVFSMNTKQLIHITSDSQLIDVQNNIITFIGRVVITQGTLKINADKIIVINFCERQNIINSYGNPVIFYQIQDNGKLIQGKALQIHYEPMKNCIILTGNAYLNQFDNNISSDKISYLIKEQKVQAFSKGNQKVVMVLMPLHLKSGNNK